MWLRLYRAPADSTPIMEIELDAKVHRTFVFWHAYVTDARAGWLYTWRADGPNEPAAGLRFDASRELLDPKAKLVSDSCWIAGPRSTARPAPRCAPRSPRPTITIGKATSRSRPLQDAVIYELHVGGFTKHPSSGVAQPGTFRGVIEKIPYLQALGITDVELLPVFAFDTPRRAAPTACARARELLGLQPRRLLRAASRVRRRRRPAARVSRHGEGAAHGRHRRDPRRGAQSHGRRRRRPARPSATRGSSTSCSICSIRRIARSISTSPAAATRSAPTSRSSRNGSSSACGSGPPRCTSTASASILRRCCRATRRGEPLAHPPVIAAHRVRLRNRPTAPDRRSVGRRRLYQVGSFPGSRWAEWNGQYRDDVRRFLRGESGCFGEVATRIAGSSDMYAGRGKAVQQHQLRHVPRRLHAQRPGELRPQAQQGATARTTATAATTTSAGTPASKAPPTIPTILRLRGQRRATSWPCCC